MPAAASRAADVEENDKYRLDIVKLCISISFVGISQNIAIGVCEFHQMQKNVLKFVSRRATDKNV